MAADAVGVAEQAGGASHIACGQRFAYRRARHTLAVHFVALHARHVETGRIARGIEHRVVAGAAGAEAKVVADQHVACAQAAQQHVVDEGLRRLRREALVEAQHDGLLDAAAFEFGQLVAQVGDARRRVGCTPGPGGEEVTRVRLEGHHAGRHAAVPRLADQQGQHGLVATVHAVEVAYRQGAVGRDVGMAETAQDSHGGGLSWREQSLAIGRVEPAPLARRERCGQRQATDGAAVQRLDAVADRGDHALDLVVAAFGQRHAQLRCHPCARRRWRAPVRGRRRARRRPAGAPPCRPPADACTSPRRPWPHGAWAKSGGGSARRRRSAAAGRWCRHRAGRPIARRVRAAAPAAMPARRGGGAAWPSIRSQRVCAASRRPWRGTARAGPAR